MTGAALTIKYAVAAAVALFTGWAYYKIKLDVIRRKRRALETKQFEEHDDE